MATIITSECINCGACEPECPNTAIYAGGAEWELNGVSSPALSDEIFYIVPSKCTECVGFYDHEACAAVCPVDCCIPDPDNLETEQVLLARARTLHPDQAFADDAPSRFRKEDGAAPAASGTGASATANGAAAASAPAAAPSSPPEPVAPPTPSAPAVAVAAAPEPIKPAAAPPLAPSEPVAAAASSTVSAPVEPVKPAQPKPAAPAPAAKAEAIAEAVAVPAPPQAAPVAAASEFDPATWEVPVICHVCNANYTLPYRHFQIGMVFYCPSCSASFVPNKTIYEAVRKLFEGFYGQRKREREDFERRRARELRIFEACQAADKQAFDHALDQLAHEIKPAGKAVKPKGLAAMFT